MNSSWEFKSVDNLEVLDFLESRSLPYNDAGIWVAVCERVEGFGMPVGSEVFETVRWEGEYRCYCRRLGIEFQQVPRRTIKLHHCHSARATDANIRQALVDRFGKRGTKKNPGRTYGITGKDIWSAFAIAIYWRDRMEAAQQEDGFLDGAHNIK